MARLSASEDQGRLGSRGFGGTEVPEPLSPRTRSRVEGCDTPTGADVGQTCQTLTSQAETLGGPGRIRTRDTRVKSPLHGILLTCRLGRKGPSTCGFAYSPLLVASHHFSSSCGLGAAWMFRQRPRAFTSDGAGPRPDRATAIHHSNERLPHDAVKRARPLLAEHEARVGHCSAVSSSNEQEFMQ